MLQATFTDLTCTEATPTCGSTCEKPLPCGRHTCTERCHQGDCSSTCRAVTLKSCHCGKLQKSMPCHEPLRCASLSRLSFQLASLLTSNTNKLGRDTFFMNSLVTLPLSKPQRTLSPYMCCRIPFIVQSLAGVIMQPRRASASPSSSN